MSVIPPFPGEPLLSVAAVSERAGCSRQAIYDAIRNGKLTACRVAGRVLVTEADAEQFVRDWPERNKGAAVRWREFRDWQAHQRTLAQQALAKRPDPDGAAS